jgi:hypothetical protein
VKPIATLLILSLGRVAAQTQADTTPPVMQTPANQIVWSVSETGEAVWFTPPEAIDDVDGPVIPECVPPPGTVLPQGVTHVVCTATDAAGNQSTSQFDIEVKMPELQAFLARI